MGTFWAPMPKLVNKQSWEITFRNQVKALASGWSIKERHGFVRLRVRIKGQPEHSESIPFPWAEHSAADAYIRIRNIYGLVSQGFPLKEAVKIADGKAPKLAQQNDWDGALKAFRLSLTNVGEKTWKNKYKAVLLHSIDLVKNSKSIENGQDLSDVALRRWVGTRDQFDISRRALWKFLRYCVNRKKFQSHWLPPLEIPSSGSKSPKKIGYPISDAQFLSLIESLTDPKWIFALMLCCVYGLRPEELRYLQTRNEGRELWSTYTKSKGGTKGDCTEPRKLNPVFVRESNGEIINWNLLTRFHIGEKLPSLGQPGDAGQYLRRFLRSKPVWVALRNQAKAEGQSLVPYSFRHRYSKQLHSTHLRPKKIADAMGHELKTHLLHYARFLSDDLEKDFEEINSPISTT